MEFTSVNFRVTSMGGAAEKLSFLDVLFEITVKLALDSYIEKSIPCHSWHIGRKWPFESPLSRVSVCIGLPAVGAWKMTG